MYRTFNVIITGIKLLTVIFLMIFSRIQVQFRIRIRIQNLELRIRILTKVLDLADPDPQHWSEAFGGATEMSRTARN
jgi:hypothetical protein